MRRTSTASSSKLHDAIQDIISQFDPLRVSSSTSHLAEEPAARARAAEAEEERQQQAELRQKFEPESDGFNYNDFLQQLRNPAAKAVARTVKSFLTEFSRRPMTLAEQVRFVHEFLEFIADRMRESDVWRAATDREFDCAREGMEKLVMNRLYPLCFSPSTSDDADKDHVLREKMSLFRWIREDHLDIPHGAQNAAFLQFAKTELLKINNFKSPRDKVICILNCCTVIYALLRNARGDSAGADDDIGADRFLPLLIYVVITANPPRLVSNVQYITRFRSAERMQSEAGYYVTNLLGAIAFIESMDASCLSITQEEFDRSIELTIWEIDIEKRGKERSLQQQQQQQQQQQRQQQQQMQMQMQQQQPRPDLSGERAQWLIDRSSDLAKSTLEKTNNFVGRLISEFTEAGPGAAQQADGIGGASSQYPGALGGQPPVLTHHPQQQQPQQPQQAPDETGAEALSRAEWNTALALVQDMFPNIDGDVVEIVLESSQGVVSRAIEQLLEMSMGDEARRVASADETAATAAAAGARSLPAPSAPVAPPDLPLSASVGGEHDVAEMEKWKGQWADDENDSGDDECGVSGGSDDHASAEEAADGAVDTDAGAESGPPAETKPEAEAEAELEPDTSGDAELARRLQAEFERQAQQGS
ncbi:hypothetical protein H4R21_003283 [Coemansia helicoidea]|uniref:Uncharacterized protein n=1 Tax=Coemansia helicoidea TaxID=1286919 RepID=A0ACC1L3I3_9FUNG|nr:hypothetical protein H4R21_003283 [Coemansia helicoidea]